LSSRAPTLAGRTCSRRSGGAPAGALNSGFELEVVGIDARGYLCYSTDFLFDDEGSRALACLQPGFDEEVIRDMVERALLSNGKDFGITLFFGSPPSEFSTMASDDVLRRAFEAVRDEADDEFGKWEEYVEAGVFE
jgi:hypothetical protein